MPEESTKTPSVPPEVDLSKEIEAAKDLFKQALDELKQLAIDRLSIQHAVIRNYLWLSVTILAAELACVQQSLDTAGDHPCPYIPLLLSALFALFALCVGIRAMTGTSFVEPSDNIVEIFNYLTVPKYDQSNHYAMLKSQIESVKKSIDEASDLIDRRGKLMRDMNVALLISIGLAVLSGLRFLFLQL